MASNGEEDAQDRSRSLEDLRSMRLMALLEDVNREHGTMRAAKLPGVNHKTVTRAMASGAVSGRMRHALELMLLAGGGSAAARQRERTEALEREMAAIKQSWEEWETALQGMIAEEVRVAVETATETLRSELRQGMESLPTRVLSPETVRIGAGATKTEGALNRKAMPAPYPRPSRGVVTREPYAGEEESYGGGMESVTEWRDLNGRRGAGTKLEQARVRERIMELEIEIIGEHHLTLPPSTQALHPSEREGYLGWRRRALLDIQRERLRREVVRWVRMGLTLGRWKG